MEECSSRKKLITKDYNPQASGRQMLLYKGIYAVNISHFKSNIVSIVLYVPCINQTHKIF